MAEVKGGVIRLGGKANSIILCAVQGHGKTQCMDRMKENFKEEHPDGVIIEIPDTKRTSEGAFCSFEPKVYRKKEYTDPGVEHLAALRQQGEEPREQKIIIHHPYHKAVPEELPSCFHIYTIPLKSIQREECFFLIGDDKEKRSIDHLLNVLPNMEDEATLWDLLHYMEEDFRRSATAKKLELEAPSEAFFYLRRITSGDVRDMSKVVRVFSFFRYWPFVHPEKFRYNIELDKILDDSDNYHLFSCRYIDDSKLRYFVNFYILRRLIQRKVANPKLKKPLLIAIPELRSICPSTAIMSFQKEIAHEISRLLHLCRTHEISIVADLQSLKLTSDMVRNSFSDTIVGRVTAQDIDELRSYADDYTRKKIMRLPVGSFFWLNYEEEPFPFTARFPTFAHKQEGEDFIERWKKEKRPMKDFGFEKGIIESAWVDYDKKWKKKSMKIYQTALGEAVVKMKKKNDKAWGRRREE